MLYAILKDFLASVLRLNVTNHFSKNLEKINIAECPFEREMENGLLWAYYFFILQQLQKMLNSVSSVKYIHS